VPAPEALTLRGAHSSDARLAPNPAGHLFAHPRWNGIGRSPDWLKMKNPEASAVKRDAEEDWGR
jgi:hypothetical protein